jgi:hypothetical protein
MSQEKDKMANVFGKLMDYLDKKGLQEDSIHTTIDFIIYTSIFSFVSLIVLFVWAVRSGRL